MLRLWLTEKQAKTLVRALRAHIITLHSCAYDAGADGDHASEEKYIEEANALDEILDIIDHEDEYKPINMDIPNWRNDI